MELPQLDDLYRDSILNHRRNPRNSGELDNATIIGDSVNPFCGDEIHLQIDLGSDGRVQQVGLQSEGCSINQASSSMLSEALDGRTLEETDSLKALFKRMMGGNVLTEDELDSLGDLRALVGVLQFPVRIKCALLSWSALEEAIERLRRQHGRPEG